MRHDYGRRSGGTAPTLKSKAWREPVHAFEECVVGDSLKPTKNCIQM